MSTTTTQTFVPLTTNQTYISTYTPDELFAAIMETIHPSQVDRAQLKNLHKILRHAIVTPQLPPSAKFRVTKSRVKVKHKTSSTSTPQPRISTESSAANYGSRPCHFVRYPKDGPPESVNQSFYFTHLDPEFAVLLPHVDRSAYVKPKSEAQFSPADAKIPSVKITPPSPSLPFSPRVLSPIVEVDEEYEPAQDATEEFQNNSQEDQMALDNNIENDDTLSMDAQVGKEDTAQIDRSVSIEDGSEGDSGIELQDTAMIEAESPVDPFESRNHPLEPLDSQDSVDNISQDSPIFSQPNTQFTESGYGSQLTDAHVQESNDDEKTPTSQRRKANPPTLRRSLRLAKKTPTPQPAASPAPSSLGKRSRGAKDEVEDTPSHKKAKGYVSRRRSGRMN